MKIYIIAALASNNVIGANNQLPWHLPEDLRWFKALTINKTIIMGRKTYESINKPLPQRTNIVLSTNPKLTIPGVTVFPSLTKALHQLSATPEVFIIGGARLYQAAMELADQMFLTRIEQEFAGDTFFPEIDNTTWLEISKQPHESNGLKYYHQILINQKKLTTNE